MKTDFPGLETVRTVLTLATRAPSISNTQPWKWRIGRASLDLYSDPSLQLNSTDPDGRELIVSCGATLNHCVVALAAMGWQAEVNRLPDAAEPNHLAAIAVHPHPAEQAD